MRRSTSLILAGAFLAVVAVRTCQAADWPMDRADAARSGYTAEQLPEDLSLRWSLQELHPPQPAWPHSERMPFDRTYQVVTAAGVLFYGTSSDCKVVAREAATGKLRWTFTADAPVRFTPAVWRDRVFAVSDDGCLYCLAAGDGRVLWQVRGGPKHEMILGNQRMISRWPARGGPVVADGIVYFGAGIWPSEGIFLYAIDAASGQKLWCNDSSGSLEMNQPHPGARAKSGISAQGRLVVAGDSLLVPTGRAVPAALDRKQGTLRYFHLQVNRPLGGSEVAAIDGHFFNSGTMFALDSGAVEASLGKAVGKKGDAVVHSYTAGILVAAHPQWVIYATANRLMALDRQRLLVEKEAVDRRGKKIKTRALVEPVWSTELPVDGLASLIVAGDEVIAGANQKVVILDARSGRIIQRLDIQGTAYGLAVADGRLLVSTDQGVLSCFDGSKLPSVVVRPESQPSEPETNSIYAQAADEILKLSGEGEGYCLDLACGEGELALQLAKRSKLTIYAVERDPVKVAAARRTLQAAGLYGTRVTVHQADPAQVPYPDYFADLIVSGRSLVDGPGVVPQEAIVRMQRPCGGLACIGRPGAFQQSSRGPLEGAADWTHQYADAANTLCSGDRRPKSPLGMLWFHETDQLMPSRHGRGPAPLVAGGRMFVEGLDRLRAVNVYNGATLWEFPLPGMLKPFHQDHLTGVAATGSNVCLGENCLFVHQRTRCSVLDTRTGRLIKVFDPPHRPDGKPGTWGYLAYARGMLLGTLADEDHLVKESWRAFLGKLDMSQLLSESVLLFALDADSGKLKWSFTPRHSIRHNAIAVGAGRVYLVDRPLASFDTPHVSPANAKATLPAGRLVCLDLETGKVLWQTSDDVFGTMLAVSQEHDALLMSYQSTYFKLDSELGGRLAAYRASDGTRLWSAKADYKSRPLLVGRAVYAEPGKWDLLTGERLPFEFSRSYGCGILAASERLLVYRSATLGYWDLQENRGTENYGGIRPGCWVNAIPAGGLVLMADAASWCTCSYLNQATIALEPK
jgi:outer membrane protein assembly factor BamB